MTQRQGYGFGTAGYTQLGQDVTDMGFYSGRADGQPSRNLCIIQTFNHQGQHGSLLTPEDPIAFALQQMSVGGFRHVPLVDSEGYPVGILSVKDIVDYLTEHFPTEILNIPPEPGRQPRMPEGA